MNALDINNPPMNIHTNQNSRISAMKITVMNQWLLASYSSEQVGLVCTVKPYFSGFFKHVSTVFFSVALTILLMIKNILLKYGFYK